MLDNLHNIGYPLPLKEELMANESKFEKARKWIVPILITIISVGGGGSFSLIIANSIQRQVQERSNDIEVAKLAMEVLNEENPNLYSWLPELVGTIKDSTMRDVISRGVISNPVVPDSVKQQVSSVEVTIKTQEPSVDKGELEGLPREEPEERAGEGGEVPPEEYRCVVMFMYGDIDAARRSSKIANFLNKQGLKCIEEPKSYDWYVRYYKMPNLVERLADTAYIEFYGPDEGGERALAYNVLRALAANPDLGNFKIEHALKRTVEIGYIPIILPNTIPNPLDTF